MRKWVFALIVAASLLVGGSAAERSDGNEVVHAIFEAYGGSAFHRIEWLRFTLNYRLFGWGWTTRQRYVWYPDQDSVIIVENGKRTAFRRGDVADKPGIGNELRDADRKFVSASYWLLFPLRLESDPAVRVIRDGVRPLPRGEGRAKRITVSYPDLGGYTPGDRYEVYYDDDDTILAWTYRRGRYFGLPWPFGLDVLWGKPQAFGPLKLTLDFVGAFGFRLWFTDVAVKLKESAGPISPGANLQKPG